MDAEDNEAWFWEHCEELERKPEHDRTELEAELLEFGAFRSRAGGEGSVAYFIDSYAVRPSRVVSLLTKFAPERVARVARDMALRFPDDMPANPSDREPYLLDRLSRLPSLELRFESDEGEDEGYEVLDDFCVGQDVHVLYAKVRSIHTSP